MITEILRYVGFGAVGFLIGGLTGHSAKRGIKRIMKNQHKTCTIRSSAQSDENTMNDKYICDCLRELENQTPTQQTELSGSQGSTTNNFVTNRRKLINSLFNIGITYGTVVGLCLSYFYPNIEIIKTTLVGGGLGYIVDRIYGRNIAKRQYIFTIFLGQVGFLCTLIIKIVILLYRNCKY